MYDVCEFGELVSEVRLCMKHVCVMHEAMSEGIHKLNEAIVSKQ